MLDLCLLGSGGMMPLPRRWLTALMTRYNGSSLLIDCGEGSALLIIMEIISVDFRDYFLLWEMRIGQSHLRW